MKSVSKVVVFVNIGSPDSYKRRDVGRYLAEFLTDEDVIDWPAPLRHLLVRGAIVPIRTGHTASLYKKIWTEEGAPLKVLTEEFVEKCQKKLKVPSFWAMRYANPSIKDVLSQIHQMYDDLEEVFVVPLYPQYAKSTVVSARKIFQKIKRELKATFKLSFLKPFSGESLYREVCYEKIKAFYQKEEGRHLLFSFHGMPLRHIRKESRRGFCLEREDCCQNPGEDEFFCYKAQALAFVQDMAKRLDLKEGDYSLCYQSRVGKGKWLSPDISDVLLSLRQRGIEDVWVFAPSFVTDCLETLEEIAIRGQEFFREKGGKNLKLIPCLNADDKWVDACCQLIENQGKENE